MSLVIDYGGVGAPAVNLAENSSQSGILTRCRVNSIRSVQFGFSHWIVRQRVVWRSTICSGVSSACIWELHLLHVIIHCLRASIAFV